MASQYTETEKETIRKYQRNLAQKYRDKHPEKTKTYSKEYYDAHPERRIANNEYSKNKYKTDKEYRLKRIAQARTAQEKRKEDIKVYQREYFKKNREAIQARRKQNQKTEAEL